ncbi:6-phospho-alpha-glucosidase, partial [Escherichia coli]|nr:6-phospho-alpha-glucosidase [Escherichia coli]
DMTISIEETIAVNYGYDRKNWIVTYYGLNHFGWYTSIYDKELQREIMPEIIEKLITKEMQVADFNIGDKTWQKTFQMMSVITKNFPSNIPNNYLEYYLYPDMVVEHTDKEYTRAN